MGILLDKSNNKLSEKVFENFVNEYEIDIVTKEANYLKINDNLQYRIIIVDRDGIHRKHKKLSRALRSRDPKINLSSIRYILYRCYVDHIIDYLSKIFPKAVFDNRDLLSYFCQFVFIQSKKLVPRHDYHYYNVDIYKAEEICNHFFHNHVGRYKKTLKNACIDFIFANKISTKNIPRLLMKRHK